MEGIEKGGQREARIVKKRALLTFIVTGLMLTAPAYAGGPPRRDPMKRSGSPQVQKYTPQEGYSAGGDIQPMRRPGGRTETSAPEKDYSGGSQPMIRRETPPPPSPVRGERPYLQTRAEESRPWNSDGGVDDPRQETRYEGSSPWEEEVLEGEDRPAPVEEKVVERTPPTPLPAQEKVAPRDSFESLPISDVVCKRMVRDPGSGKRVERDYVIRAEQIRTLLRDVLPKGWVAGEIAEIKQVPKSHTISYLPADREAGRQAIATCSHEADKPNTITLHDISYSLSPREIVRTLIHEVAHANDWKTDNEMTPVRRDALKAQIRARLSADDRYPSSYVEDIPLAKEEHRIQEYWAVICEQYFENPNILSVADYRIVDAMVKKTDPTFDPAKSLARMNEILYAIPQS